MAFVVEDGTGIPAANAYCSTAYADGIHSDLGNAAWAPAIAGDKQSAIVRATIFLEGLPWRGLRLSPSQGLQFPRDGTAIDYDGFAIAGVPDRVARACAIAALKELTDPGSMTPDLARGGQISSAGVGPLRVTYAPGASAETTFTALNKLLMPLLRAALIYRAPPFINLPAAGSIFQIGQSDNPDPLGTTPGLSGSAARDAFWAGWQ